MGASWIPIKLAFAGFFLFDEQAGSKSTTGYLWASWRRAWSAGMRRPGLQMRRLMLNRNRVRLVKGGALRPSGRASRSRPHNHYRGSFITF